MQQERHVLGIDLAPHVLHAVGLEERGKIGLRTRLSRHDLRPVLAKLPPGLLGLAACAARMPGRDAAARMGTRESSGHRKASRRTSNRPQTTAALPTLWRKR